MSSSRESKIEDFAFDYLQHYYSLKQNANLVLTSKSDKTKSGAEVDGLFAFKDKENSIFLATISYKNSHPIASLLTDFKKNGLGKTRFLTPFVLLIASSLLVHQNGHRLDLWVLPFIVAIVGYFLHSFIRKSFLKRRIRNFVSNLSRHPASEKWLGMSVSSLYFRNNSLATYFLKCCQRRGIGLLTVGKRSKVVLMQEPRTYICRHGDYLANYEGDESLRKALTSETVLRVA